MDRLNGKIAIITGAAGGIGYGTAKLFLQEGAKVAICDMNQESVNKAVSLLSEYGEVFGMVTDVTDHFQCDAFAQAVIERWGKIDILINNAGITKDAQFYKMKHEDFYKVIEVNLYGTFNMCKAVVPNMMENHYGKIVSPSSTACIKGNFGQCNYSASKAALISFTRCLGRELGKYGINVNAVAPGVIKTGMIEHVPEDIMEQKIKNIPVKRVGTVEDVAATYASISCCMAVFSFCSFVISS
ncbi:MAG: SDR family NAD(P)-dependent oxidoreductase [Lawsonibacter sp.]